MFFSFFAQFSELFFCAFAVRSGNAWAEAPDLHGDYEKHINCHEFSLILYILFVFFGGCVVAAFGGF